MKGYVLLTLKWRRKKMKKSDIELTDYLAECTKLSTTDFGRSYFHVYTLVTLYTIYGDRFLKELSKRMI